MKLKEILNAIFRGAGGGEAIFYRVKCAKCGEIITVRINPRTDMSSSYDDNAPESAAYVLKKEILGNNCRNIINITCYYDASLREISRDISETGTFV
ncbi:MAG: hypothetical protein JW728_07630 [Candidatus Aureabacteria bacterium]|nr:hypothetical protein [Candidatus Auribacterota bacterium]